jgi:hypothetical protein
MPADMMCRPAWCPRWLFVIFTFGWAAECSDCGGWSYDMPPYSRRCHRCVEVAVLDCMLRETESQAKHYEALLELQLERIEYEYRAERARLARDRAMFEYRTHMDAGRFEEASEALKRALESPE